MRLSKNFTLDELLKSNTATRLQITEQFKPPIEIKNNLKKLAANILQPLRDLYGKPITVNSGYRCKRLNDAVGGSKNSDHMRGMAADITCDNPSELYYLASLNVLPFRQMIYYPEQNFVHISYNEYDKRGQKWVNK